MSTHEVLSVKKRSETGTGAARACRNDGFIPGVVYGNKQTPETIAIDPKELLREMQKASFFTHIHHISIDGKNEQVLAKDVQFHPVTDYPMHIDFMRVSKGTKLRLHIPIYFINDDKAPGIKQGGTLNIVHHKLEIIAPVDSIPESFTVDLTGFEAGKSIQISDLKLPQGVIAAHPERDNTIATISGKSSATSGEEAEA